MYRNLKARTLLVAAVATLALATGASAKQNFLGGLHFNAGFPQGDFKKEINKNAYGIGGQFFFAPESNPLAIGLEAGFMNYGNETRKERFSLTIPDVTVDVTTSNNLVQGLLVGRIRVPKGPIRPYGDVLIGFTYLWTETKIKSNGTTGEDVASSTNKDDAVFVYGGGGGIMFPVFTSKPDAKDHFQILLDAGLRYLVGGKAEYLKKGAVIRHDSGVVTYDVSKSKTDMLRLHVGVMVNF
jgi:hypothetical protein